MASNLNFLPGQTVPNLVVAPVGIDGSVDFFNGSPGSVQLIADVAGYALVGPSVSWSQPVQFDTDANGTGLAQVSCPTVDFCSALDGDGNLISYDGSTWSPPTEPNSDRSQAIVCVSASHCVAGDGRGELQYFDGAQWSTPVQVDGLPGWLVDQLGRLPDGDVLHRHRSSRMGLHID